MHQSIELLAPGGDPDSIKAAIIAGADAVYCGLQKFNARNRAANISFDELNGILGLAHTHNCKVYLTLNIIFVDFDFPELLRVLNRLANTSIDGVIVQDLGLLYLLSVHFQGLEIHASTQLTTHNKGQIEFLSRLSAHRVNLSRELNIDEIRDLTRASHKSNIGVEVFVHGSYCISFSGLCYMSAVLGASSGNRGRCSQPCRDRYLPTPAGKEFPLNLKDNSAFRDLSLLSDAGVDALKIEGRVKKFHYVYTVTNAWTRQLQRLARHQRLETDSSDFHKVFNRDFSDSYLMGDISRSMFSDHPRNQSASTLSKRSVGGTNANANADTSTKRHPDRSYDEIAQNKAEIKKRIEQVSAAKAPLTISISGTLKSPLCIHVQLPEGSFTVQSEVPLTAQNKTSSAPHLTLEMFSERLKAVDNSEYFIEHLELKNLQRGLFIPFKEITSLRKRILFILRGSRENFAPVVVPVPQRQGPRNITPTLSVLLSSRQDLHLCHETDADIHFKLPSNLGGPGVADGFADLFAQNPRLIPWFPAVLIGADFAAAVELLRQGQPKRFVTDNTGLALEASGSAIPWIAGPSLNIANSYSLMCLKEKFACTGAFLSNELSCRQILKVEAPDNFRLYYRIYHPLTLLTSRQCLFHQVTGCEKSRVDPACLSDCARSASISTPKQVSLHINKTRGNYSAVYHHASFLNTNIVSDIPNRFSAFLVDLRNIETQTRLKTDKLNVIQLFEKLLDGDSDATHELTRQLHPTTSTQYRLGLK